MKKAAFTGHLYQLESKSALSQGAYVKVNGPWDTFGQIVKSTPQSNGLHLNLIRGVRPDPLKKPVSNF